MSNYTPDRWEVLKLTRGGDVTYKVLAGWYGGYLGGDSWQLNSGIVKVLDTGDAYEFHGHSGSVYTCHKVSKGMSGLMQSIFNRMEAQASELPGYGVEIAADWPQQFEVEPI
jgi:hypothetical protein